MTSPRRVTKEQVKATPHIVWNTFLDVIVEGKYEDMDAIQRAAHLTFLYEGEVQNGGHLQYFENLRENRLDETVAALGTLGATEYQRILREAIQRLHSQPRPFLSSVEDFCEEARKGEYQTLDTQFYECNPDLAHYLGRFLKDHQDSFVIIE